MKIKPALALRILIMASTVATLSAQHVRTEHWQNRNQQFEREIETIASGRTIFLGNSITEGFELDRYFPITRPVNRGISGDHTDGLLERLETSVLRLQPAGLFLMIGINDIGAGDPDSIILANYRQLLDRIQDTLPDSMVFIQSILPTTTAWPNCPGEKIVRLNTEIRELAIKYGFKWIDLYPLFVDASGYLRHDLTSDGLHLNGEGYRVWSEVLYQEGLR